VSGNLGPWGDVLWLSPFTLTQASMKPPARRTTDLTDAEAAVLHEVTLFGNKGGGMLVSDLELRLAERGFNEPQIKRALMSLLRRSKLSLAGANRVVSHPSQT
jgi:hypothetical protein